MPILVVERIPEKWPDYEALVQNSTNTHSILCGCLPDDRSRVYELSDVRTGGEHAASAGDALILKQ